MPTLFESLLIVHFVFDWIFQGKWETFNKAKDKRALLLHCSIYTIGFVPVFYFYHLNFWWLGFIFLTHFFIDDQRFVLFILEKIRGVKRDETSESFWRIIFIGIDQTLHLLVLYLVVLFSL